MDIVFVTITSAAIITIASINAYLAIRQSNDTERGSLPGKGKNIIEANYSSGAGGGGHSKTYTIPQDPQDYAKCFIPKRKK